MTPRCRTCNAPVLWATHHDGRRLPHDEAVVDHTTHDSSVLVRGRDTKGRTTHTAWDLADLVHHTASRRGWTDTRAAHFVADAFTAHRRHRCHQERTTTP